MPEFLAKSDGLPLSISLFLLRLATGAALICHGYPKIQDAGGWMGPDSGMPAVLQALAAISEFAGGIALIFGLLSRLFALLICGVMVVAIVHHHLPAGDPFVGKPGSPSWELAAVYLATTLTILLVGPGTLALDAFLFRRRPKIVQQQV